jgi:hypothetical protein
MMSLAVSLSILPSSAARDIAIGDDTDKPAVRAYQYGTDVIISHAFGDRDHLRVWVDAGRSLVHGVLDLHGRLPVCVKTLNLIEIQISGLIQVNEARALV